LSDVASELQRGPRQVPTESTDHTCPVAVLQSEAIAIKVAGNDTRCQTVVGGAISLNFHVVLVGPEVRDGSKRRSMAKQG